MYKSKFYIPTNLNPVNVTTQSCFLEVLIHPSLSRSLNFKAVENSGFSFAWADAEYRQAAAEDEGLKNGQVDDTGSKSKDVSLLTHLHDEEEEERLPRLLPAPEDRVQGHPALFLGNVKFAELKRVLVQEGIAEAEFHGGMMVCNDNQVMIRKEVNKEKSQIRIQGALSREYFAIRDTLYERYIRI
mmetsp:Transcript_22931/g.40580  ORF Transcript_22931/g.40580 Transcript_22931/m.40580 type:complete len:186 (+) Transcript_22931:84-641(+)